MQPTPSPGRGVELRLGRMVEAVTTTCVELDDGDRDPHPHGGLGRWGQVDDTVASRLGTETGPDGRLVVEPDLSLPGRSDAYAVR